MITSSSKIDRAQRGAVSVETALVVPLLLLVVLGGVHFGLVITARHRLADAANYAVRAAVIARQTEPASIRARVKDRMGATGSCLDIVVNSKQDVDDGVRRLEVSVSCKLSTGIGGDLLGAVGPDRLNVTVSMPLL
jgi:Flp pilus assembly protein TadG